MNVFTGFRFILNLFGFIIFVNNIKEHSEKSVLKTPDEKIKLTATLSNYESFVTFIETQLSNTREDDSSKTKILTACEEIIVNIINYAYQNCKGSLEIIFINNSYSIAITFIDNGKAFNPLKKPDADVTLSLEEREYGGLGILIVKKLMDDIMYEYKDKKNCLTIIKHKTKNSTMEK